MNKEIVYFHMATKGAGENSYPPIEPFITIMNNENDISSVFDDEWAKENEVCITMECFNTFIKFYITATKDWVEKNYPTLLTEHKEYLKYPDDENNTYTTKKNKYLKYEPENFGVFVYMTKSMKRFLYDENN